LHLASSSACAYYEPALFAPFLFLITRRHPCSTLFPYTTLFRSLFRHVNVPADHVHFLAGDVRDIERECARFESVMAGLGGIESRSEEHTSELQSHLNLVCRLLLEKKNFTFIPLWTNNT